MKNKLIISVVLPCCLFVMATPAYALFRLGIHGGKDVYSIAQESTDFRLQDGSLASLTRDEVSNPTLVSGTLNLNIIPFVDTELGLEGAMAKYHFIYVVGTDTTSKDAGFGRIALYTTLKRNVFQFPPLVHLLSVYVGAGGGVHLTTPIICRNLIYDKLKSGEEKLEVSRLVRLKAKIGTHAVVGVRLTPPATPLALDLEAKYVMLTKGIYKEPGRFFTLSVGLSFDF